MFGVTEQSVPFLFVFFCPFPPSSRLLPSTKGLVVQIIPSNIDICKKKDARLASAARSSFDLLTPESTRFTGQNIGPAYKANASSSHFGHGNSQLHMLITISRGGA